MDRVAAGHEALMAAPNVATPWYYRQRQTLIGFAYGFGFFFGFLIANFPWSIGGMSGLVVGPAPSYALLGIVWPALGTHGALAIAFALALIAWLYRVWAASYLSDAVVWSQDVRTGVLQVAGPYRFSRNPLYLANLILALGVGLLAPPEGTILVVALNWLMVALMIRVEEPQLLQAYGDAYREYVARVPRLFPLFFRSAPPAPARPSLAAGLRSEIMIGGFALAMLLAFVTGRPISWPVFGAFAIAFIVHEIVNRPVAPKEQV